MPAYPHIEHYYAAKQDLIEYGGSDSELNIRPAFQNCLDAYCGDHRERLRLVPELPVPSGVVPDGTVKDTLRMARGYWEAKDSRDDLDAEITRKFDRGYPRDNIIFEDSRTAVLIQNREEAMRADMSRPGDLHRIIRRFLDYELPQIEEFREAQSSSRPTCPPSSRTCARPSRRPRPRTRTTGPPPPASWSCAGSPSAPMCQPPTCGRCCSNTS